MDTCRATAPAMGSTTMGDVKQLTTSAMSESFAMEHFMRFFHGMTEQRAALLRDVMRHSRNTSEHRGGALRFCALRRAARRRWKIR
jgi:hypothetical protein